MAGYGSPLLFSLSLGRWSGRAVERWSLISPMGGQPPRYNSRQQDHGLYIMLWGHLIMSSGATPFFVDHNHIAAISLQKHWSYTQAIYNQTNVN